VGESTRQRCEQAFLFFGVKNQLFDFEFSKQTPAMPGGTATVPIVDVAAIDSRQFLASGGGEGAHRCSPLKDAVQEQSARIKIKNAGRRLCWQGHWK
jgi:hypothetical protein